MTKCTDWRVTLSFMLYEPCDANSPTPSRGEIHTVGV